MSPIHDTSNAAALFGELLYDSTLAVAAANFDIQSISQSFNALRIVLVGRFSRASVATTGVGVRFNNDSAANYDWAWVNQASTANHVEGDSAFSAGGFPAATATASYTGASTITIPAYAQTTFFKSCLFVTAYAGGSAPAQDHMNGGGNWKSTAAINRITVYDKDGASNFLAGSRCTLYGTL